MRWVTVLPRLKGRIASLDFWHVVDHVPISDPAPSWLTARAFTRFITFLEVVGDGS